MHEPSRPGAPHKFHVSEAVRLLDPRRLDDVDPAAIIAAMELRPGIRVGDTRPVKTNRSCNFICAMRS